MLCIGTVFGQQLQLEKASPFTAVKWKNDEAIVKFKGEWYQFEGLAHLSKKELIGFCKQTYGDKWKKRFSEDLITILKELQYIPNQEVQISLSKNGITNTYKGTFTFENRQACLAFNRRKTKKKQKNKLSRKLSKKQALEDIQQFKEIITTRSSYIELSTFDYKTALQNLSKTIVKQNKEITVDELTHKLARIMSEIGDRHASVKNKSFKRDEHKIYGLQLPFGISVFDGKLIALKREANAYSYYNKNYPYLKSINGIPINTFMDNYNYKHQKAPKAAKLARGAMAIQNYGALLFKNNKLPQKEIEVVFTNGKEDKKETVALTYDKKGYSSSLAIADYKKIKSLRQSKQFKELTQVLDGNIGYINIPMMFHYDEVEGLERFIENTMKTFLTTKALIIDLRNNPGGGREILQTFTKYLIPPEQSPWVANVAYLRTDKTIAGDESSMSARYLYSYKSSELTDNDRKAITRFNEHFNTEKQFDTSKFSHPFYMVLHSGKKSYTQPVYILINEESFSAATVFTSAFKRLPNVKIVGITTDGSSGNSKKLYLRNSNIRVKVSTMLSFQRNGKTLDGNGTIPDIHLPVPIEQIFTGKDLQLQTLVKLINTKL